MGPSAGALPKPTSNAFLVALGLDRRSRRRLVALFAALVRPQDGVGATVHTAARVFRVLFAPDVFLRQLTLAVLLHLFLVLRRNFHCAVSALHRALGGAHAKREAWQRLERARRYDDWAQAAAEIDEATPAAVAWKRDPRSPYYTHAKVRARIDHLARCRSEGALYELMYMLRSRQYRTQFNVGRSELHTRTLTGTKQLIEEYLEATVDALRYLRDAGLAGATMEDGLALATRDVLAFMNETRHAYGRTALHLSGGAALGVHHLGVLKAMLDLRLLPRILSGTSAGSIIAAIAGVRTQAELEHMLFNEGEMEDMLSQCVFFERVRTDGRRPQAARVGAGSALADSGDGGDVGGSMRPSAEGGDGHSWHPESNGGGDEADEAEAEAEAEATGGTMLRRGRCLQRLVQLLRSLLPTSRGPLLCVERLGKTIAFLVGEYTFLEAFNRTGRILNIMVSRSDGREPMLLNYLTAPHVLVWSAARASSAVPGVFAACELWARGPNGEPVPLDELKFTDGCVDSDLPKARLTELFNINLFIVSQVNPAATLLSTKAVDESGIATGGATAMLLRLLRAEASSYIRTVSDLTLGRLPFKTTLGRITNLAVQEYDGDVNLFPWFPISDLLRMIENPTVEYLRAAVARGQRAVWSRASQLQSLCRIEFEMDTICRELHAALMPTGPLGPLSISRRPSAEHAGTVPQRTGCRRIGQIPSYNTLDVNGTSASIAGGSRGTGDPGVLPGVAAATGGVAGGPGFGSSDVVAPLRRPRCNSTPVHKGWSSGNLSSPGSEASSVPPVASVASYLNLVQMDQIGDHAPTTPVS